MRKFFYLILLFTAISCVEKYENYLIGDNNFLIIEATLSDRAEPFEVRLNRTINLDDDEMINETNAIVSIYDGKGQEVQLNEVTDGVYQTNSTTFRGVVGESYILTIHTEDNEVYESEPVLLREALEIDSVFITQYSSVDYDSATVRGIDINVATKSWDDGEELFIKWDYTETWKLFPTYSVMGNEIPHIPCYNIKKSSNIITDNTSLYTSNKINKKRIIRFSESDTKPYFGYSILVQQSLLNDAVYDFWKMLEESTEENGDVFDNIPYNAIGNIKCISNKNRKVFGYFNASAVSEKRFSFKPPVYGIYFNNIYDDCVPISYSRDEFDQFLRVSNMDSTDVYIYDVVDGSIIFFINRGCVDCSLSSTTTEKPDYWLY